MAAAASSCFILTGGEGVSGRGGGARLSREEELCSREEELCSREGGERGEIEGELCSSREGEREATFFGCFFFCLPLLSFGPAPPTFFIYSSNNFFVALCLFFLLLLFFVLFDILLYYVNII